MLGANHLLDVNTCFNRKISTLNAIVLPSQSTPSPEPEPVKRKPGRPKGSLNKHKRTPVPGAAGTGAPKRLGRPPGTGKNQLARLAGTIEPEPVKNPVGRPRLHSPPPRTTEIRLGKIVRRIMFKLIIISKCFLGDQGSTTSSQSR